MASVSRWSGALAAVVVVSVSGFAAQANTPVLEFGGSDRVFVEESTVFQENFAAMTMEFWIKPDKVFTDYTMVMHRHDANGSDIGNTLWWGGFDNNGNLTVTFNARAGSQGWDDGVTHIKPTPGVWHHVAGTWDGATGHVYVNGELVHSYSSSPMTLNGPGQLTFGGTAGGAATYRTYEGLLSEVRLWNHARSAGQIDSFRLMRLNGSEEGLLGYWPLDESAGDTAYDNTPNGNHGTIVNANWTTDSDLHIQQFGFSMLDLDTGSPLFTNSNVVDIILPLFDLGDYDLHQFAPSNAPAAGAWLAFDTNNPPATATFPVPDPEGEVKLYAFFKDAADTLPVKSLSAEITYVRQSADVTAVAQSISLPTYGAVWPAVIQPEDIDTGSSSSIGLFAITLSAAEDETPAASQVTLTEAGVYTVTLTVMDMAGNTVSDTASITVYSLADQPPGLIGIDRRWLSLSANAYATFFGPSLAADGDPASYWQSPGLPAWLQIDLGASYPIGGLELQASANRIRAYELYVTDDPQDWGEPVAEGTLPDMADWVPIWGPVLPPATGRYVILRATEGHGAAARINELRVYADLPFALASPDTGHLLYTRENTVIVTNFPVQSGYDQYQITASATEPADGWLAYDPELPPAAASFDVPSPEGPVALYAWFRDSTETLSPVSVAGAITYIRDTADVTALAPETLSVLAWGEAFPALIHARPVQSPRRGHLADAGSSSSIGFYDLLVSSPDDETPDLARVTLAKQGPTIVTLTAIDAAGNTDSADIAVSVGDMQLHVALHRVAEDYTGPVNTRDWPYGWQLLRWTQQWLVERVGGSNVPDLQMLGTPRYGYLQQHHNLNAFIDDWAARNVRVACDFRTATSTTTVSNYSALLARFRPNDPDTLVNERRGYRLYTFNSTRWMSIQRLSGNAVTTLVQSPNNIYASPVVWTRKLFEVEQLGSGAVRLRAKIWPRDEPEPEDWTLEYIDDSPAAILYPGLVGIHGQTTGNRRYWYQNFEARSLVRGSLIMVH